MQYERLKQLERFIPPRLGIPLRRRWRNLLGSPEIRVARELADPTRLSVDAGAATGGFSEILSQTSLSCEAFEANPANWPALHHSTEGMNVHINECALSDFDGEVTLRIPLIDEDGAAPLSTVEPENLLDDVDVRQVQVPCRRLDSLDLEPVGFMKIDVEGHESAVLRGAAEILRRDMPNLLIEIEDRHRAGAIADVTGHLAELGYDTYFLLGRHLKPWADFDKTVHQDPSAIQFSQVAPGRVYVNNFVFVADPRSVAGLISRRL